ncbi:DNA-binding transcriptional regulator, LysR family [Ferrimonas sediminum]|uniref:DNA-binding transcriptional regulator, LysR family n=1 Tax=Ferrimonas sediminum TaxID=718193 RepID=A0A1G8U9L6_9GAMM|nr:LysR family transcriptional regulator [Ferrimonas sediminum]SDJ50471.1 DNA-binding transcriptional regulator, LysR family [Ferrimonas sediminum]
MNDINNIDLNLLKSLQALLLECHVGRAAKRMHVTQSAMSHTLARLRDAFEDPLFVRTSKGLSPTPRAQQLGRQLEPLMADLTRLFDTPRFDPGNIRCRYRILSHDFIVQAYLAPQLNRIQRQAPEIQFELDTLGPEANDKLDQDQADLIIGAGLDARERFMQQRLVQEPIDCVLAANHPALEQWQLESLLAYPHITVGLLAEHNDPVSQASGGQARRRVAMITHNLQTQLPLLVDSSLIAFLPRSLATIGERQYGLSSRPSPVPLAPLTIRALWHQRRQHDHGHRWIRQQLFEGFNEATEC